MDKEIAYNILNEFLINLNAEARLFEALESLHGNYFINEPQPGGAL